MGGVSIKNAFKENLGISLSVGVLSGVWAFIAGKLGVPSWPAFIGWSIFFFTGANWQACKDSFPAIVLGPILAYLTLFTQMTLGTAGITSALVVIVLGFTMTIAQSLPIFSIAAVTFVSCNIYFASGSMFDSIVVTAFGLVIGLISIPLGEFFDSIIFGNKNKKTITQDTN